MIMNAIDFLTKEHHHVKQVLDDLSNKPHREETKKKMFDTLCKELLRHEEMEHKIWYPHFKQDQRLDDTVKHLLTEEKSAEEAIKRFGKVDNEKEWDLKFSKFKKAVEHHAHEEEEKLFPVVKKILSETELEEIGKEMYEFKSKHRLAN